MKFFNPFLVVTLLIAAAVSFKAHAAIGKYYPGTFALDCKDSSVELNQLPLGIFEFSDDLEHAKILPNYIDLAVKIAPMTFKNLKKEIQQAKPKEERFALPQYDNYDSITMPPKDCSVLLMASTYGDFTNLRVNQDYWNKFPQNVKEYLLFELLIRKYLSPDLASSDYRRFALYIATGKFDELSTEYKIAFLKFHGIKEYSQSGVSINLDKELVFFEDTQNLKAAYPFANATFEQATLNPEKFVSFFNNGVVSAVSTMTAFTRTIKGQTFSFLTPASELPPITEDERYYPRTEFYSNGEVKQSFILPVDRFLNIITDIKKPFGAAKKEVFKIRFYEDSTPAYYAGYPGNIVLFRSAYQATDVVWWDNGNAKEVGFTKRYSFEVPGNGKKDILYLLLKRDGTVEGYAL